MSFNFGDLAAWADRAVEIWDLLNAGGLLDLISTVLVGGLATIAIIAMISRRTQGA